MKIQPVRDKVLIKPIEKLKMSKGGIIIPDNVDSKDKLSEGIVVAVGPGRITKTGVRIEPEVDIDDHVFFLPQLHVQSTKTGKTFAFDSPEYEGCVIVPESAIKAIVDYFYDEDTCFTAKQLRAFGVQLPEDIHDSSWVPKSGVAWDIHGSKKEYKPDEKMLDINVPVHIYIPFKIEILF